MANTLGNITFNFIRGAIQPSKPQVEGIMRYGGNKFYFQQLNNSSPESSIKAIKICKTSIEVKNFQDSLNDIIGLEQKMVTDQEIEYDPVYLKSYNIDRIYRSANKAADGDNWIVEITLTLVTDNSKENTNG